MDEFKIKAESYLRKTSYFNAAEGASYRNEAPERSAHQKELRKWVDSLTEEEKDKLVEIIKEGNYLCGS